MKKILLSLSLLIGLGASAQIAFNGDFEDGTYGAIYGQFGGGTRVTTAACNGANGGQLALSSTQTSTGWMIQPAAIPQTSNGQKVDVQVSYKKGAGIVGSISIAYFVKDQVSGLWNITNVGTPVALATAAITTCAQLTATIPVGALQPSAEVAVGVWVTRTSGTGNVFVDDINFTQDTSVTTVPACTTLNTPAAGSTSNGGNGYFSWTAEATAVNYKLTVGTTSGGSDIYNATVTGLNANVSLPTNATLYAKLTPSNAIGDATSCTEVMFNTDANIGYCGPIISIAPTATYPISSVTFAGTGPNTSAATVGSPAYEDFTAYQFNVLAGSTYPLNVVATGVGANRFGMTVWIDWNNDGDFADANEQYFNTPATYVGGSTGATINLLGNITVPASASAGNKRMRIKYNFSSSLTSLHPALETACSDMNNGQVEDYTLVVSPVTAAPTCTTFTSPTNGATAVVPNPAVLTWAAAAGASAYKLYVGTTSGGTDVENGTVVTTTSKSVTLNANTVYYAKVVPYNNIGEPTGCTEIMFTTGNVVYCTATATSTNQTYERIGRVVFSNIDNTSNTTPASSGVGYEDFTALPAGIVTKGQSYPITVTIANFDNDQTAVWIDFDQDGIFAESEKTTLTTAASATGTIAIPAGAKLGNTRMRVRTNYSAAPPACGSTTFGQVEDYTIQVNDAAAATINADKNKLSVYPNPFQDVLKISDIKGVKSISVSDVSGRQVKNLKPSAELNLSDLKTGLYIVTLQMEDGTIQSFKAIKK